MTDDELEDTVDTGIVVKAFVDVELE